MARNARARTDARTAGGPQPRPLPRNPQRTAGDFVKAFAAFVALSVLLIGCPARSRTSWAGRCRTPCRPWTRCASRSRPGSSSRC
ncbi:hypothetical protein NKH77_23230 [Streptomyces sp. M19]